MKERGTPVWPGLEPPRTSRFWLSALRKVLPTLTLALLVLAGIAAFRGKPEGMAVARRGAAPSAQPAKPGPVEDVTLRDDPHASSINDSASSVSFKQKVIEQLSDDVLVNGEVGAVSGRVVDASGGSIAGAWVVLRRFSASEPIASASSDVEGRFRVTAPLGYFEISAQAEAYSRTALALQIPADNLRLVLAPEAAIEGRVKDRATGEPVGNATVRIENRNGVRAPAATAVSDEDGSFRIPSLAGGGYDVQVVGPRFRSEVQWVTVDVGQVSEPVELFVDPAGALTTTLLVSGEPCAGGSIQLSGPVEAAATTSTDGTARLDGLLPGHYTLRASCDGAVTLHESVELNEDAVQRTLQLTRGLELRGSVVDGSGSGLAGLSVLVKPVSVSESVHAESATRQCVTDAAGDFVCAGFNPGSYDCEVSSHGQKLSDTQRVSLAPTEPASVVLTARDSASIRATLPLGSRGLGRNAVYARRRQELPVQAAREGDDFVFDHLELGAYRVYVGIGIEEPADARRVELTEAGQVATVSLELPASQVISGRVLDAARQPVADAWVHATTAEPVRADSWDDAVLTDESGAFTIADLSPGQYELRATHSSGEGTAKTVEAGAQNVVVALEVHGSLSGLVTAATAEAVNGFTLAYGPPGGGTEELVLATGARWAIPWLAPGEYHLVAHSTLGTAATTVTLAPGARLDVPLVLDPAIEAAGPSAPDDAQ